MNQTEQYTPSLNVSPILKKKRDKILSLQIKISLIDRYHAVAPDFNRVLGVGLHTHNPVKINFKIYLLVAQAFSI